jgi:hypothetical protein
MQQESDKPPPKRFIPEKKTSKSGAAVMHFKFGLFPLLRRGNPAGYHQIEIQSSRLIGNPCWGYQKLKIELSFSLPIFGFWPDYSLINWVRAAYNLEPLEGDLPF